MEVRKICCTKCGAVDVKLGYAQGGYGILLCIECLGRKFERQEKEGKK